MSAPEAVVISIGEEVLRGEVTDTNRAFLGEGLSALGFRVTEGITVPDEEERIVAAFERAANAAPVTVATGGLGPTGDDLTAAAAAKFAGVELVASPKAIENIAARIKCRPDEVTGSRLNMALVPDGAGVYPNPCGAAPGIHVEKNGRHLFLLPGVPHEMRAIFEESVAPALETLFPGRARRAARLFHVSGWPESRADAAAREALAELLSTGLELGTKLGRGWVSLRAAAEGEEGARLVDEAAGLLAGRFGEALWGEGPKATIEAAAARELLARKLTLALAESCTGGLVASRLVSVPGVSAALLEGLVTYSNAAKIRLLGVDPAIITAHGAVSAECAGAMATGLRTRCGADITLAVTGIAGPQGGSASKPVGTVHFAVAGPGGVEHDVQRFGGVRHWVRERAASHALWMLWRAARQTSDQ